MPRFAGPIEVFVAHGFGRSYGRRSAIPYRALPGIKQCALWDDLRSRPSLPTFALITDVGNDLLYGASPNQIIEWVGECGAELRAMDANIVTTELPLDAILATTRLRFQVFRTIFFPPSRLTFERACELAHETNEGLKNLSHELASSVVRMDPKWYGIDPIHIRMQYRTAAWNKIVEAWRVSTTSPRERVFRRKNSMLLHMAYPHERWFLGRHQRRTQPSVTLSDGSVVAIY
ncbi:hypothetical protein [Aeoliella sp. SH292]|uniref:hypothetical protein n=1 Tax=Aeoliella sp. SH292 TaxID=3454464 RepID=UPI003F9928E8